MNRDDQNGGESFGVVSQSSFGWGGKNQSKFAF